MLTEKCFIVFKQKYFRGFFRSWVIIVLVFIGRIRFWLVDICQGLVRENNVVRWCINESRYIEFQTQINNISGTIDIDWKTQFLVQLTRSGESCWCCMKNFHVASNHAFKLPNSQAEFRSRVTVRGLLGEYWFQNWWRYPKEHWDDLKACSRDSGSVIFPWMNLHFEFKFSGEGLTKS